MLADIFALGVKDGSLRADLDPQAAAHIFLGTVAGWRSSHPDRTEIEAVFSELERAFATPASKGD
ncbi:hypothetical protein D3C87_2042830 [compost metagenome]